MKKLMLLLCSFLFVLAVSAKAQEVEEAKKAEEAKVEEAAKEEAVKVDEAKTKELSEVVKAAEAAKEEEEAKKAAEEKKAKEEYEKVAEEYDFDDEDFVAEEKAEAPKYKLGEPMKKGDATPLLCNWFKMRGIKAGPGAAATCAEVGVILEEEENASLKIAKSRIKAEKLAEGMLEKQKAEKKSGE